MSGTPYLQTMRRWAMVLCAAWLSAWTQLAAGQRATRPTRQTANAAERRQAISGVVNSLVAVAAAHRVVAIGEAHDLADQHEIIDSFITDGRFPQHIRTIAVEFGSARYESLVDRCLASAFVPEDSLRLVWRNTTQPLAWTGQWYGEFFRRLRSINASLGEAATLRVVLLDPPIAWERVHSAADMKRPGRAADMRYAKCFANCAREAAECL